MPVATAGLTEMSPAEFRRMSEFIYQRWGIHLPPSKKALLEGRLRKRLHQLRLPGFKEYCQYLFSPEGMAREALEMVDLVTTNKTEFLREPDHFEYLTATVLPTLAADQTGGTGDRFLVWSAGCSSGEEPYTLAMVLSEFAASHPHFRFRILATDISARMLAIARDGIYPEERIAPVPLEWRRRYLMRSKDPARRVVRFTPEIRARITFQRLNLMEVGTQVRETFQIIFCRNVIIYFDRFTQEKLLREFYRRLPPGGYLFLGHSETLTGLDIPLLNVAPTVYRKPFAEGEGPPHGLTR
ncbi:MAG: Chemotaxis protein methyltransferase CheR [Candidatus Ozemobacter sibiricus]|uniref:protein-glutamate O-methyltransferase n=1 Tax=Candidatus Ozemobacter sibiricus TaxID=2268124 RepID=A0A367ZMM1_9BACT|nr:MAG: Chemotaxis protein methyltransferase CheR [Candidatus Ozemobacter sibiricus]